MIPPDAVVAVVHRFDGELVDIRPRGVGAFPETLNDQPRALGPFTACADCGAGTWVRFGAALCRPCAWARWRTWQIEEWRTALA